MNSFNWKEPKHSSPQGNLLLFDCWIFCFYLSCFLLDVTTTSADDFESADDLYDAVGGVLHEATESEDEEKIKKLCIGVMNLLQK